MKKAKVRLKKYIYGGVDETPQDTNYSGSNVANQRIEQAKQDKAAGYSKAAGNALMTTGNQMYQPQDDYTLTDTQNAQNAAVNNSIDNTAASVTPWYGAAKGLSNIGKSQIKRDEYGDAKSDFGKVSDDWLTPDHQLIMNGYRRNGVGGALFESSGFGKVSRTVGTLTGNSDNTNGFWGWTNKMNGSTEKMNAKNALIAEQNIVPPDLTPRSNAYFANGGTNISPNAEVEKQENSITPGGEFTQYDGNSHEAGGIPTNLESGEMVFSDKLKLPGTKKTFAALNKPFNTNKEDKILESNKIDNLKKATADLMKAAKLKQSMDLFNQQESLKEAKLASYAKRLGVDGNKFGLGGTNPSTTGQPLSSTGSFNRLTDTQLASTWNSNPQFKGKPYTTQVEQSIGPNGKPYYNYNFYSPNQAQVPIQPQMTNTQPVVVQDPMKQVGYNGMLAPRVETYRNGGLKRYDWGGEDNGDELVNNFNNTLGQQEYSNIMANYNAYTSADQALIRGEEPPLNPTVINNITSNNRDYSQLINLGTTAVAGIAANAGNIYDLKRSKTVDREAYNRVTPELLDPSATIRYNNQVFTKGAENVKNASNGNSSTYIQNRKDLAINQMLTNARIKQDYANQNAGITNQSKYYNAGVGDKETIANLMNQAQSRNIKGAAIGAIGNNVSNSITGSVRDTNMSKRDKDYLKIIAAKYPEIMKDPELQKLYK